MPESYEGSDDKEAKKVLAKMYKDMQREQQLKSLLRQLMEPEAYERIMNISVSNHDLYIQLSNMIVQLAQSNQISGRISDAQLVSLLNRLTYKPEPKIEFKHK
ncbi:MAG: DNA-binding protein [Candidatus Marsarchaeota archaeon]|nr:DNA-binding protein [Candidatus Marsarchaeota archaeon]MCL5102317.1 DNA-binding protein [Candidatus Marsarchaeota archaeon]